jgi:hypothetical protein
MQIEFSRQQLRYLLDLCYAGNWILNSTRGVDRIIEYDMMVSKIFGQATIAGIPDVSIPIANEGGIPSPAYESGGIQEAIVEYDDSIFWSILAEELATKDLLDEGRDEEDSTLPERMEEYIQEFQEHGTDNVVVLKSE